MRDLPDGGRSVTIDGRTYFLVAKEDLAALSSESEASNALEAKNDTLLARHREVLTRYDLYQRSAETLVARQESQIEQAERITRAYDDLYKDLKRLFGLSPWSLAAGVGVHSLGSEARLTGVLGFGYQHWLAQYQFGKDYGGVVVGFQFRL